MSTQEKIRQAIFGELETKINEFLYNDREDDPFLPKGAIERAVYDWDITIAELTDEFSLLLRRRIPPLKGRPAIEAPDRAPTIVIIPVG